MEVRGELHLPEGAAPFSGARVSVLVEDVTQADAPAVSLGEWVREDVDWTGGPIPFRIDANPWDQRADVALSARVDFKDGRAGYWNVVASPVSTTRVCRVALAPVKRRHEGG